MSNLADLLTLLMMLAAGLGWLQLSRGRELAANEARRLCQRHGLQLLDETVGLRSLRLRRHDGRLSLIRGYAFDVSIDGADREASRLWMTAAGIHGYQLPTISGSTPEPAPTASTRPSAQIIDLSERIRRSQHSRLH
ncbi:DUF3301 domain-containing protein [Frateuria aurantia]|uniref:DUF3301 domain-containing protein n=1 Tax=Frateuria aurantia (strain ATCC 33424 / DSM 6220 / KCTC 2777 / LMG 1558 / NBRC 3245 / NCIMB 13370) TaxID=767434 RepID=H8L4R0_FRAAD|nr:DUF3301 domain-containing protein [Frateuria aurantia]AFC86615.1 Protein of unknown function (DUF3301) [Frateuria aurantia DSM 6220]